MASAKALKQVDPEALKQKGRASVLGINLLLTGLTLIVVIYLWLEEMIDLPHMVGFQKTPINWVESIMETIVIGIAGAAVMIWSNRLLRRIHYLEGFEAICARCKRVRANEGWQPIEFYLEQFTTLRLNHTICPDCAKHLYDNQEGPETGEGE